MVHVFLYLFINIFGSYFPSLLSIYLCVFLFIFLFFYIHLPSRHSSLSFILVSFLLWCFGFLFPLYACIHPFIHLLFIDD